MDKIIWKISYKEKESHANKIHSQYFKLRRLSIATLNLNLPKRTNHESTNHTSQFDEQLVSESRDKLTQNLMCLLRVIEIHSGVLCSEPANRKILNSSRERKRYEQSKFLSFSELGQWNWLIGAVGLRLNSPNLSIHKLGTQRYRVDLNP